MNNTSFNVDRFADNSSLIAGYPEGRIIEVTYYSQNAPITDTQSSIVDLSSWTKDDVHVSWTEIRNFELRLPDGMNFEYDQDSNNCKLDGTALTFPGFMPKPGDFFIYMLRNSTIGIFYISSIARLAIGQETYHRITFTLQDFLTDTMRDRLRKQSGDPWYFDKTKYLVGNYSMLSSTGFINQKELQQLRKEIIRNYTDRFYRSDFSSFIRPDNVYDPYVVEFWNKKVSYDQCHLRPTQLLIAVQNYHKTIWAAMTGNPIRDLKNVERHWSTDIYASTFWGANITSLLGNKFLTVGKEEGAKRNPNIDNRGDPILVDTIPLFDKSPSAEDMEELNDQAFIKARMDFYEGFLPFRKCAPHQHPVDFPMCDESKCVECSTDDGCHPVPKNEPPYPILSNDELGIIWRRLNMLPKEVILSDSQLAELRGYILWYRTTYEGTLSRFELESQWRTESGIGSTRPLTDGEAAGLQAYIKSYRDQYQPVLTDRELEMIWRTKKRLSYEHELTDEEIVSLMLLIRAYRDAHGAVPDDGYNVIIPDIGRPFTTDELSQAGALMYDDFIILGDVTLTELDKLIAGDAPLPPQDTIPPNYVPTVYQQNYPKPNHHIHCHDVCHHTCNAPTSKKKTTLPGMDPTAYALSNEFYLGSIAMDAFEKLVYDALTNQEINPSQVVDIIKQYLDWPDADAFYRLLLSIYLIDKSLHWLRYHS